MGNHPSTFLSLTFHLPSDVIPSHGSQNLSLPLSPPTHQTPNGHLLSPVLLPPPTNWFLLSTLVSLSLSSALWPKCLANTHCHDTPSTKPPLALEINTKTPQHNPYILWPDPSFLLKLITRNAPLHCSSSKHLGHPSTLHSSQVPPL